ncbi:hypothetical protein U1Q18_033685 [Sarracenia purpurea var. burkii]
MAYEHGVCPCLKALLMLFLISLVAACFLVAVVCADSELIKLLFVWLFSAMLGSFLILALVSLVRSCLLSWSSWGPLLLLDDLSVLLLLFFGVALICAKLLLLVVMLFM